MNLSDERREEICQELIDAGWKFAHERWFLESFPPEANTLPLDMAYERLTRAKAEGK